MAIPNPNNGFYSMGDHTLSVPMELFSKNRSRLVSELKNKAPANSVVLLQGGADQGVCQGDSSDVGPIFRQESYFHWAFGVLEPDCFGAIDVETGKAILYIPKLHPDWAIWMGSIPTLEETKKRYVVDEVRYTEELRDNLKTLTKEKPTLLVMEGTNSDSGKNVLTPAFDGISDFEVDKSILFNIIAELRVIKTEMELEAIRYACKVSSEGHKAVMRKIKPGMKEYQCESEFLNYVYSQGGCRHVCYNCIAGAGRSGAVLHYGHAGAPNNQTIKDGDIVLFDFGAEYYCFCSDITCSYPANGKFTEKQKVIYNAVLRANRAVFDAAKPGVSWVDMHLLANRVTLEDLLAAGILQGDVDDMMKVNLAGRVFQPHGLGHFMGNDVHDVGGYLEGHPERAQGAQLQGVKNLRTARVLKANMVLTIEPGCYFIDHLLDNAFKDPELNKFLVKDKIQDYRGFGGVRIEDDVIIGENGCELMSIVPRTVEQIEQWMAGVDVKLD